MNPFVTSVTHLFGALTIVGQVAVILFLPLFVIHRRVRVRALQWIGERAIVLCFILTAGASVGSLFYSEIAGFVPCMLCWIQRAFLFPQAILFGIMLWTKNKIAVGYAIALSVLGGAVAAYHYYGQMLNASALPCPVVAEVSPCAVRHFVEFGYITMPLMSLTVFLVVVVLMTLYKDVCKRYVILNL